MILRFEPIKVWPKGWLERGEERSGSPFSSTYQKTLDDLDVELEAVRAVDVVIQVDAAANQIRADGGLRADAKVAHPGVILTVATKSLGTMIYATDRFGRGTRRTSAGWAWIPAWQQNLRAIALGMEALRKVERYGIAEQGQQYAGYKELGSGIPLGEHVVEETMTIADAAIILADGIWNGERTPEAIRPMVEGLFKEQAKRLHPDAGGDEAPFRRLVMARNLLANL